MKNYVVDAEAKTVTIYMLSATKGEIDAALKYQMLGYDLITIDKTLAQANEEAAQKEREAEEEKKKQERAAKRKAKQESVKDSIWTEKKLLAYLEIYGTEADLKEFENAKNEPCMKDGTIVIKKDGKPKVKGYMNALQWFKKNFKNYPEAPNNEEK